MKIVEQKNSDSTGKFRFLRPVEFIQQAQTRIDGFSRITALTAIFIWQQSREKSSSAFNRFKVFTRNIQEQLTACQNWLIRFNNKICSSGVTTSMPEGDKRRLRLLNQINILHFITCLFIPFLALLQAHGITFLSLLLILTPVFVSALVLFLNSFRRYNAALLSYFILYPFFTCLIYLDGMNLGMELYFIMYGILAVFFLKEISHMVLSVSFSMVSYFMLAVVLNNYTFNLKTANPGFYFFNQLVAIILIFYGLYLIMKENAGFQSYIMEKNDELERVNLEIEHKNEIISEKALQLEEQTIQLTALNAFKTKLFSIISHDLRAPVYALKDLFNNAADQHITAEEIKELIPDAANDLSYTAGLMENLLQWAKSQMQANDIKPQTLDVSHMISETMKLYRLQAEAKKVYIESKIPNPVYIYADKDMVNLVLRNLVSNAIKFTPSNGQVCVEAHETHDSFVEVCVKDNGKGMTREVLQKINENNFYTTKGTANESGTGLGLMLCKEFLAKNGGRMHVESKPGKGSVFSFTLPISA
jgi:two-component system, sensor histidine kinase and response regulator